MNHAFIDNYADLDSPLHRLNPKTKIILFLGFLLTIIFTPVDKSLIFIFYIIIASYLFFLSRVPFRFFAARIIELIPFILLVAFSVLFAKNGKILFLIYVVKALLAISLVLLLSCTTRFNELVKTLRAFKVPHILVNLLSFFYRYSFILEDELLRKKRAYEARSVGRIKKIKKLNVLGNIIGALFIHTYERAEKIYLAMCARGYNGDESS